MNDARTDPAESLPSTVELPADGAARPAETVTIRTYASAGGGPAFGTADPDWPEFMRHNRVADGHFGAIVHTFPEVCLVATAGDGAVVADGQAVPFALGREGRGALPGGGWERVLVWAFADARDGVEPDSVSAISIAVSPAYRGRGPSARMLAAMRSAARARGVERLVAPVRPTRKAREPRTPMQAYVRKVRADGLPYDPWLRVHVRAGGRLVGIAPTSWVIADSLAEWRSWTGLAFDRDGDVEVPGALAPVRCDLAADCAVYVEPNVWFEHRLRADGRADGRADVRAGAGADGPAG